MTSIELRKSNKVTIDNKIITIDRDKKYNLPIKRNTSESNNNILENRDFRKWEWIITLKIKITKKD